LPMLMFAGSFVGPAVHWMHGHLGRGLGSLGLNVALRAGAGIVGYNVGGAACPEYPFDCTNRVILGGSIGILIGSIAATALDAGWLAYDEKKEFGANTKAARRAQGLDWSFSVTPMLDRGRIGVGFAGQF